MREVVKCAGGRRDRESEGESGGVGAVIFKNYKMESLDKSKLKWVEKGITT